MICRRSIRSALLLAAVLAILASAAGCARHHRPRSVCVDECQTNNDRCLYWARDNDEIERCDRRARRCLDRCPEWR